MQKSIFSLSWFGLMGIVLLTALAGNVQVGQAANVGASAPNAPQAQATLTPTPTLRQRTRKLLQIANVNSNDNGGGAAEGKVSVPGGGFADANFLRWSPKKNAKDQAKQNGQAFRVRYEFFRNGERVYDHKEDNDPYCPFQDNNGQCNLLDFREGNYFWRGSGRVVEPGDYEVRINSSFRRDDQDDGGDHQYTVFFQVSVQTVVETFEDVSPLVVRAAITAPQNNSVLSGIVVIRGTATSNNFAYYKFEFEDARCAGGVCFVADAKRAVNNNVLLRWDTRTIPNGSYLMRLVVADKWGRTQEPYPRIAITIAN